MLARLVARGSAALVLMAVTAGGGLANPVLLFEPATGLVLHAEDPDRSWHPASVTKMMTAYLTFEAVKTGRLTWDGPVTISEHARSQPATRIGLRGGIKLNVEQAVRGLILRSANDFATALAETVGGTEEKFVELMNDTAKRIGMTRTVFKNPHGLPDMEQVTTARDLAKLTLVLLRDFPDRAEVFSTPTVVIHKGTFHSQNDLLRSLDGGDGMKTGFTCASGYNVVASATRNGRKLVAVVLGALNRTTRSERATELLEAGFAYLASAPGAAPATSGVGTDTKAAAGSAELAHALLAIPLADMPMAPAEAMPPYDMSRETRTHKCGNGSRVARRAPKPSATADAAQAPTAAKPALAGAATASVVTGSVRKAASAKPRPARPAEGRAQGDAN